MKKVKILFASVLLLLQCCYPSGPEYTEELDSVYTDYDPAFNFGAASTFALPDDIIKVSSSEFRAGDGANEPEVVPSEYADVILSTIRENMKDIGWTEVPKGDDPDVILLPSATTTSNVYYYYDWYYWGWWYPGYAGSAWGWYYPGDYYPSYRGGYRSGTLLMQMTDAKHALTNNTVSVVWTAVINGLLDGNAASIKTRLHKTIHQAFLQSTCLHK